MRSERRKGAFVILFSRCNGSVRLDFPVGNFETGDIQLAHVRAHVVRNAAQVFPHHADAGSGGKQKAQVQVPVRQVHVAVRSIVIPARLEAGQPSARSLGRLIGGKRQEYPVFRGFPREGVNAVKAQDVVDPVHAENLGAVFYPAAPPGEVVLRHDIPSIQRNAPVLPPFGREWVFRIAAFRRGSSAPFRVKQVAFKKDVGAGKGNANGDIPHQLHIAFVRINTDEFPLFFTEPLEPAGKILFLLVIGGNGLGPRRILFRPVPPDFRTEQVAENLETDKVFQPAPLFYHPFPEFGHNALIFRLGFEVVPGSPQNPHFPESDLGVVHQIRAGGLFPRQRVPRFIEYAFFQAGYGPGFQGKVQGFQSYGADGGIGGGAFVPAQGIDGEQLEEPHMGIRRPVNPLAQGRQVPDAVVIVTAQGEQWQNYAG